LVSFGNLIARARKEKGLTLEKMATACGTCKSYLSGIENGKVNPPAPMMTRRIAHVLGLTVTHMLMVAWAEKAPKQIRSKVFSLIESEIDKEGGVFVAVPAKQVLEEMKEGVPKRV